MLDMVLLGLVGLVALRFVFGCGASRDKAIVGRAHWNMDDELQLPRRSGATAPITPRRSAPAAVRSGLTDLSVHGPGTSRLLPNENLTTFGYIQSPDGRFRFTNQGDGNVVLSEVDVHPNRYIWGNGVQSFGGTKLVLQSDANMVERTSSGGFLWQSGVPKVNVGSRFWLELHNNGVLTLSYDYTNKYGDVEIAYGWTR